MDPRHEMELRRNWLYETQLRRLNYDGAFRRLHPGDADPRLELISEKIGPVGGPGVRPQMVGPAYLDNHEQVWTQDERARRDTFARTLIGEMGNWLDFVTPHRLIDALRVLKVAYEQSTYCSEVDVPSLGSYERTQPWLGDTTAPPGHEDDVPPGRDDDIGPAISRTELATAKPWLIPELFNANDKNTRTPATWVGNLEKFITNFENETQLVLGGYAGPNLPFDPADTNAYRSMIRFMMSTTPTRPASDAVKVRLLSQYKKNPTDKDLTYKFDPALQSSGFGMAPVAGFPFSDAVKYWTRVIHNPLREVVTIKANSDMGLCMLVRLLYRYGTLPATLGSDADLTWRTRSAPDDKFAAFFADKAKTVTSDPALLARLHAAQAKLAIILEESHAHPRSATPMFSVLAGEILKAGIKSYKFWLDEPLRAKGNATLNKIKNDLGYGKEADIEMEFWSENHYIMFASSEYLLGQLWEHEEFQPGKVFLRSDDKTGIVTGTNRKERGTARVLKWLNNRLMFGWMEFHSSGYYREHLWALLNLADFSLDPEVKTKAAMAVDLLLFDVLRYLHKGTMGGPGGRSQFKSKNCGWDNDLGDVVELITASRGIFNEGGSSIGCSFATSTYVLPDVLLELGVAPPSSPFTDRSRVSITFEEAPKYGISWSLKSDEKDSVLEGFAPKRDKHSGFLARVNQEISRTHHDYGTTEDDTVFFWGMSAFFNKQVVRNTFATVTKFNLDKSPVFATFVTTLLQTILPAIRRTEHGLLGAVAGGVVGGAIGIVAGAVVGVFESDVVGSDLESGAADDLSIFIEGNTRTRANILVYRTPDAMLASIQNFRTGQLNFQSSVNQATLNASTNVFTTADFAGFDISDLTAAAGGAIVGAGIGALVGPLGAAAGAVIGGTAAVIANQAAIEDTNPLGDDEDGPGWWTGYWALPMIVQHDSAAIIAYDFHGTQEKLAESASHVWFPKKGFDRTVERRTSAYDNADFFLLDITDIGPKGFWLFGRVVHPPQTPTDDAREAYVGVFSNQRPAWLDQDFHFYKIKLDEQRKKPIDALRDAIDGQLEDLEDDDTVGYTGRQVIEIVVKRSVDGHYKPDIERDAWVKAVIDDLSTAKAPIANHMDAVKDLAGKYIDLANLERIWPDPLPADLFADRDWYVEGKNIWIIQMGSKAEFGTFESFMDRVSSARVHISDSGDMECTYDIPKAGGGSDRLTLDYGNGGQFDLNGGSFQTDLYPRFENPFVRGGRVEWGQRQYVIEWNGKSLLHDLTDFEHPVRQESPSTNPADGQTIASLVIFFRTGHESMDAFTVGTANVDIACHSVAANEVVAVGPVGEGTDHDAEWIFFDAPALRSPDMTITVTHPASSKGDATPEWEASFSVKALMADRTLKACHMPGGSVHFQDEQRSSGPIPFTVALSAWAPWETMPDGKKTKLWTVAIHPPCGVSWHDFNDLVVLDTGDRLWHRRLACGGLGGAWEAVDPGAGPAPDWSKPFSMAAVSDQAGGANLFVVSDGHLLVRSRPASGGWSAPWVEMAPYTVDQGPFGVLTTTPVTLGPGSAISATFRPDSLLGVDLHLIGADGNVYAQADSLADEPIAWQAIPVAGLTLASGIPVHASGGYILAIGTDLGLWGANRAFATLGFQWQRLSEPGFDVATFAASGDSPVRVAIVGLAGEVRICELSDPTAVHWTSLGPVSPFSGLAWAEPTPGSWRLFACATDGTFSYVEGSDGTPPASNWAPAGTPDTRAPMMAAAGIAAACRAMGQIELFGQADSGDLARTWWS